MSRKMVVQSIEALALVFTLLVLGACRQADTGEPTDPVDSASESPEAAADAGVVVGSAPSGLLNPNVEGEAELQAVEGMGPEAVEALLDGRPFFDMVEVDEVLAPHMDVAQRETVYRDIFVPLDLNSATREEILLIPGVGDRMAHEFEEYRPYEAIAEFRREMGKYVDDEEVDRLTDYVFVPLDINTASAEELLSIPGVGERMKHEFEEYRPYTSVEQFRREIGKYVDEDEVARLERYFVFP